MWELIASVAGPLVGYLTHKYLDDKKWSKARDTAVKILQDPTKTDNAREAMEIALLQTQFDRLGREADKALKAMRATPGWYDK